MAWTKDEIKSFGEKDLRISKLAIVKSLIDKLSLEDVYGVKKITELSKKYINYVYAERRDVSERSTKRGKADCVISSAEPEWEQIAIGLNLAIPNSQNVKILNQVLDEYKNAYKASANPTDILGHIMNTFGRYPEKTESVKKIVSSFYER